MDPDEDPQTDDAADIINMSFGLPCGDAHPYKQDLQDACDAAFASPHVAALIALQLQYARQNNLSVSNEYLRSVIQNSAVWLTGEDPVFQGHGKAWAAETDPPPPTPHDGAIDLMAALLNIPLPALGPSALALLVLVTLWTGRWLVVRRPKI
jgi:hypothetical protein